MPAQYRLRPHQQPEPAKHVPREPVQQGSQQEVFKLDNLASNARSRGKNRGRVVPSCRSRNTIWWRSERISASLSRSLTASNRSYYANAFVTPR